MDKEKMVKIYEAMADMTIQMIRRESKSALYLEKSELEMVRVTQSLYETINHKEWPAGSDATRTERG